MAVVGKARVWFNQVVAALHSVGVADDRLAATAAYVAGRVRRVDAQLDRLQAMLP